MKKIKVVAPSQTESVVKRAFFLAYLACGGAFGMGVLQERNGKVTEDHVWSNVQTRGDYPRIPGHREPPSEPYGDYVFGRMMKLSCKFDSATGEIEISDSIPRRDYQGWSGSKFPTYESLFVAAATELGVPLEGHQIKPLATASVKDNSPLPPPVARSMQEVENILAAHPINVHPLT